MQKNHIELAGYLGAKPTARFLPSGTKVANARLAESYTYTDAQKKEHEHTNWHGIVCYGRLADIVEQYDKGDNVFVEGTLQVREFTPADGAKRRVYEVVARAIAKLARTAQPEADLKDNDPQEQHTDSVVDGGADGHPGDWPV